FLDFYFFVGLRNNDLLKDRRGNRKSRKENYFFRWKTASKIVLFPTLSVTMTFKLFSVSVTIPSANSYVSIPLSGLYSMTINLPFTVPRYALIPEKSSSIFTFRVLFFEIHWPS